MEKLTIYHNPRCSKSRQTLKLLQIRGIDPIIIEYLKTPLNLEQLNKLRQHFTLKDFVRINEPLFKKLNLTLEDEAKVLEAILEHPILMQRPIVVSNGKAIIARPPETVLALLT